MKQLLNEGWKFYMGGENPFFGVGSEEIDVTLPHDFSISQTRDPNALSGPGGAFYPCGVGAYKKKLDVPKEWKGKRVELYFEGVYMNATVHFNKNLVGRHAYGYTGFFCDLTPYLDFDGENEITVNVNNDAQPNSRWYSGSGIYRNVWLRVSEPCRIENWGVYATTPVASAGRSEVKVETALENHAEEYADVTLLTILLDADGKEVASVSLDLQLEKKNYVRAEQSLTVSPAVLWSDENPYLYTLKSILKKGGSVIDETETKIGIRSISFDAKNGFQLNGKTVKMKGGCVHHDCGLIGSAAFTRAEERKTELLKQSGFNAVRCAHNPPSPAFLDACDRLGMLVIDEAFDCWNESKNYHDYGISFDAHWKEDLASMILRDRNHPSVVIWSDGNEIVERDGRSDGYRLAVELADFVRALDPTRPVINAICGVNGANDKVDKASLSELGDGWDEKTAPFAAPLDIVGYNYLLHRYEYDGIKHPDRIICGTETFPMEAFDYWESVERNPHVIGDFVWTSLDYLGEAGLGRFWYGKRKAWSGEYPWHMAYCGDIDICGFKRPQSYYRDCVWGISKVPYIAVQDPAHYGEEIGMMQWSWPNVVHSWNWDGFEGKSTVVDIYCQNEAVELIQNGKSLGKKPAGKAAKHLASFETSYEPGELIAVAYEGEKEVSRSVLKTSGKAAQIRLAADRTELCGDSDLSYVTVELLDENGNPANAASDQLYFSVHGAGTLLAVGSSDPLTEEIYVGNQRKAWRGRAMAVVRSSGVTGEAVLTVMADGMAPANVTISVN